MYMRKFIVSIVALASILTAQAERIESPSGNVCVDFELTSSGEPVYSMKYNDKKIIKPSKLGYELKGNSNLREGFKLIKTSTSSLMKLGSLFGERLKKYEIIIMNFWQSWNRHQQVVK